MALAVAELTDKAAARTDARAGKYLVFHLGKEEFGIPVLKVREIMGILEITAVPQTPAYVKGIINLRGKVIPVADLRIRFGLPETPYTQRTCIIVVQIDSPSGPLMVGVIVDEVSEVLNIASGDIEDTPTFGATAPARYLQGMAKVKGKVKILLEIDGLLNEEETNEVASIA